MKITKALIPVAGKGTRFLPFTKEIPKEMLPIINRPLIHYIVEEAFASGIRDIVLVSTRGKNAIEDYFSRNLVLEQFLEEKGQEEELAQIKKVGEMVNIITVKQKKQQGLGDAILCAREILAKESFVTLLGDEIILSKVPATQQLIRSWEENGEQNMVGVVEIDKKDSSKYGIVDGSPTASNSSTLKLSKMVEKPSPQDAPSNLAAPGRYIFTPDIFEAMVTIGPGVGGEIQLTDAINQLAQKGAAYAHKLEGHRYDAGNVMGHINATLEMSLNHPHYGHRIKELIKEKVTKYNL